MASASSDSVDTSPQWLKGPGSGPGSGPDPVSLPSLESEPDPAVKAVAAASKALGLAKDLQSEGQLRKAFLECQSVLIDHSHNLPDKLSAQIHHMMARISIAQGKEQRAEKYLKRAQSLDPSLPGMEVLTQGAVKSVEKSAPGKEMQVGDIPAAVLKPEPELELESKLEPELEIKAEIETDTDTETDTETDTDTDVETEVSPVLPVHGRLAWVAPFWARAVAAAIDALLVAILISLMVALSSIVLGFSREDLLSAMAGTVSNLIVVFMLFVLFLLSYVTVFARFGGQTLGKIILGLRVVRLDGHSLTTANALLRALGMILAALPGLGGFVWAGFDLRKRAWHDRLGKTLVVKIKPPASVEKQSTKIRSEALEHL